MYEGYCHSISWSLRTYRFYLFNHNTFKESSGNNQQSSVREPESSFLQSAPLLRGTMQQGWLKGDTTLLCQQLAWGPAGVYGVQTTTWASSARHASTGV